MKLKIGLLGVGHLGEIHLRCIQALEAYELLGFYDPDPNRSEIIAEQYGVKRYDSDDALMAAVEVVDIVTPTVEHFRLAKKAIEMGKHVFIEKPMCHRLEEARALLDLEEKYGVKIQIGHVERFNPALLAMKDHPIAPMFIEAHRLAVFNPRGTDVSVILDLMIHDLDIILSWVDAPVKFISASGVAVVSNSPDIANARIEFENGCVANLTASRISMKQMRKVRLFQRDAYISLDFLDKQAQIVRLYNKEAADLPKDIGLMELDTNDGTKMIHVEMPQIEPVNAIQMELNTLASSILKDVPTPVPAKAGYRAMDLAYRIIEQIEERRENHLHD
ncbi:MAG: Gfo/Idh/MocA family oxidoreductase [Bacteroidota bacterium]